MFYPRLLRYLVTPHLPHALFLHALSIHECRKPFIQQAIPSHSGSFTRETDNLSMSIVSKQLVFDLSGYGLGS